MHAAGIDRGKADLASPDHRCRGFGSTNARCATHLFTQGLCAAGDAVKEAIIIDDLLHHLGRPKEMETIAKLQVRCRLKLDHHDVCSITTGVREPRCCAILGRLAQSCKAHLLQRAAGPLRRGLLSPRRRRHTPAHCSCRNTGTLYAAAGCIPAGKPPLVKVDGQAICLALQVDFCFYSSEADTRFII